MASPQRPSSSSVPRRTLSDRISAVGAKINRALSNEGRARQGGYDADAESITSTIVEGQGESCPFPFALHCPWWWLEGRRDKRR